MCPSRNKGSSPARQVSKVNGHRPTDAHGQAGVHLSALQRALQSTGLITRYDPLSSGPPRLVVTNPEVTRLSEAILAAPIHAGTPEEWWFWWSWAERICRVDQLQEAARRIARVLAIQDEG